MIQRQDGWLFLSHSDKDFELVRQIRNTLEEHGFRPILFFLKCISEDDELDNLIKREIAARRWFVFVDSENSRASKWAQDERAHAEMLRKNIHTIDASQDYLPQLMEFMKRTTVFLSYSYRDREIAAQIRNELIANDFQIWWDDGVPAGAPWPEQIASHIETAGFCLLLISQNSLQSKSVREEINYAFHKKRPVIPVLIGDIELPPMLQFQLSGQLFARLSASPTPSELSRLIDDIIRYQENCDL